MSDSKIVIAAAEKKYKEFQGSVSDIINVKMKDKLNGFMNYIEKNVFQDKEE